MGNSISVGNLASSLFTHIPADTKEESSLIDIHKHMDSEPPPECPMHRYKAQPKVSSFSLFT